MHPCTPHERNYQRLHVLSHHYKKYIQKKKISRNREQIGMCLGQSSGKGSGGSGVTTKGLGSGTNFLKLSHPDASTVL